MKKYPLLLLPILLILLFPGCSEPIEEIPPIVGSWVSYRENYDFYADNTCTLTHKGGRFSGTYKLHPQEGRIELTFKMQGTERQRSTGYSIDSTQTTLVLDQSQFGTTVVFKRRI